MNYILFDDATRTDLFPITLTRPVAEIRVGVLTIREKWERFLGTKTSTFTEPYLAPKWPLAKERNAVLINASILPTTALVNAIKTLNKQEALVNREGQTIAYYVDDLTEFSNEKHKKQCVERIVDFTIQKIQYCWDIFALNGSEIRHDFSLLTTQRRSEPISLTNTIIGNKEDIFIEKGATIECATLNTTKGPIYVGKDAEIMEGSNIRGPFALCHNAVIKMQGIIYPDTTIGPFCKVAGEISNAVFIGYSNKAHAGFVGNSVIGEWCNIAAGSDTSNLNNTYQPVRVWNQSQEHFIDSEQQFCGLIMGDHSKCGIGTQFNTGTTVGVNCNLFGAGYHRNHIKSFSWGGAKSGYKIFNLTKAFQVAEAVMQRRGIPLTEEDKNILTFLYDEV